MKDFGLYIESWIVYITLGLLLLFLIDFKIRHWRFELRIGILSLIAAGAFTPQMVNNSDTFAPLLLTSLLNAEIDGITSIYQGIITLAIVWAILFTIILGVRHLLLAKKKAKSETLIEPQTIEPPTKES